MAARSVGGFSTNRGDRFAILRWRSGKVGKWGSWGIKFPLVVQWDELQHLTTNREEELLFGFCTTMASMFYGLS